MKFLRSRLAAAALFSASILLPGSAAFAAQTDLGSAEQPVRVT
jgi:hypothetical protein